MNPSLIDLSNFVPTDETEIIIKNETVIEEYWSDTKESWSKGKYYLGGHKPMNPNDKITDDMLLIIFNYYKNEPYYCNNIEMASIYKSERQLSEIKIIIARYKAVQKKRILIELNKIGLNEDVNKIILTYY
jgi:hypothetical protein